MRVLLDEHPCPTDATSVAEAIAEAASVAERQGRVLVEIVVDGTAWTSHELGSEALGAAAADEIRLISADLRGLISETLTDAGEALVETDALQREAAEMIQSDQRSEALDRLGQALEIWQRVHDAVVRTCEALAIDLDALPAGEDVAASRVVDRLHAHLRSMHAALESSDPVGLADTLLYDGPDVILEWRQLLDALRHRVDEETED